MTEAGGVVVTAIGTLETVAEFHGPMPVGVAVSREGRVFVSFPRWGEPVDHTVAELVDGQAFPYPDQDINRPTPEDPSASLMSVQSVVVDATDRLWILDTGQGAPGPAAFGGPKLVAVDLRTDRVVRRILLPEPVALPSTYLNDLRLDLRQGTGGMAFITDSSPDGPNGLIVVDLDSGRCWRKLHDHPSTKAVPGFLPIVEGRPLLNRPPGQPPRPLQTGVDGIAIDAHGERLYYCPTASRRLYSVNVAALADESLPDEVVAETVLDHGEKGVSDGLEADNQNRIYTTNYEHNAILRRQADGVWEALVQDGRLLWPDSLSVSANGYLYITANQLHRQPSYHAGKDLRTKPYYLFRTPIDAGPVALG